MNLFELIKSNKIVGVNRLDWARKNELSFFDGKSFPDNLNVKYAFCRNDCQNIDKYKICVADPRMAFIKFAWKYFPPPVNPKLPFTIDPNHPQPRILHGRNLINRSTEIGGDGHGFQYDPETNTTIQFPHYGGVRIGDNVSIGSFVCVDRAPFGDTIIGDYVRIDSVSHIGHGVKIGKNTIITAGFVSGGSAVVGDNCYIGLGVTIRNKVKIGNNSFIGMGSVVVKDIPDNVIAYGNPCKVIRPNSK